MGAQVLVKTEPCVVTNMEGLILEVRRTQAGEQGHANRNGSYMKARPFLKDPTGHQAAPGHLWNGKICPQAGATLPLPCLSLLASALN